jgi:outer membrane protein
MYVFYDHRYPAWQTPLATLMLTLLSGCTIYFDTAPKAELANKVEQRLEHEEALALPTLSKTPPQPLASAVKEANLKRAKLKLEAPPDILDNNRLTPVEEHGQLSIADARALALTNNLDLKIALLDPGIAATYVSEEQAKFDDLIFANAKYSNKSVPLLDGDVVSFKSVNNASPLNNETAKLSILPQDTEQLDIEAGIVIPLRTGGKITLSSPLNYKETDHFIPSEQYLGALRFSISQPLLRGAGIDNNVAGIRIARYEQSIVDLKTRLQTIRILATIDKAYWSLYMAWSELDIRRRQYQLASQNLAMVRRRVKEGLTAAVEINRAEIGVGERLEILIIAKTRLKISQRRLLAYLNDPRFQLDSSTFINPTTLPTLIHFDFARNELVDKAMHKRLELLELELKLAADITKIDYLENQTLPQFMLDYSYGTQSRNDDFDNVYADAFGNVYDNWSIGLKLEIPLTNELRKSRLSRAVQQRLQRLTTRDLKELTVRREIYDALDQVDQNWQRIIANRQNVVLAGANYTAELKQFKEGLRTMTEVLETLTKLGEAQVKEVRAIADYQVALVDLAYATGTLLGHSKIDIASPNHSQAAQH